MKTLHITWLGAPKDVNTRFGVKQKFSIKAEEYGDEYLSVWSTPVTRDWKVGGVVEVLEVTTRDYQGKTYYDIKMPAANMGNNAEVMKKLEEISVTNTKLFLLVSELVDWKRTQTGENKPKVAGTNIDYPEMTEAPHFDAVDEDIPF